MGDIHPPGLGAATVGALYGPRELSILDDGSVLAVGLFGRVQRVADARVDVVAGYPQPAQTTLARFLPTFARPCLVAGAAAGRFLIGDGGVTVEVDVSLGTPGVAPPETWTRLVGFADSRLAEASAGVRLDDGTSLFVHSSQHCVGRRVGTDEEVVLGTCGIPGAFDGFLDTPTAIAVSPTSGALYVSDTGNNRVLRRDVNDTISVVIGDGSPSSAGEGGPARVFPVNAPRQLLIDEHGNLFVTSTTSVRVVKNVDGDLDADGEDDVSTIFGAADARQEFPARDSRCLAGLARDGDRLYVADTCVGFLIALDLVDIP